MTIFLTILKIIGIVLLCIIGLIIVLILYVLLAPFWFKLDGSLNRKMDYAIRAKATTFLHFAQVHIEYTKENGLDFYATISGPLIKVFSKGDDNKASDNSDDNTKYDSDTIESIDSIDNSEVETDLDKSEIKEESNNIELVEEVKEFDSDISLENMDDIDDDEFDDTNNETFKDKFKKFLHKINPKTVLVKFKPETIKAKIDTKFKEIKEKIKGLRDKADEIMAILKDNDNKVWLKKIFSGLGKVIKSMKFNMRGTDLDFSLGSPDITGQVCGVLALFPPTYDKKVHILPDFQDEDLYFDGDVVIKFRLQLIYVVVFALKVLMDSNTKKLLNLIK